MAKKKGFNKFEVRKDCVAIFLYKRNGDMLETIVDLEDLDRLISLNLSWHPFYKKSINNYYAKATEYVDNDRAKCKTHYLHRVILNYSGDKIVDHEDHNTLNNRKNNLKLVTQSLNMKNGEKQRINNTSGERNVAWDNNEGKWLVQLQVGGKNKLFDRFDKDDLENAKKLARELREKIYKPEFEEENYNVDNLKFVD